MKTKQRFQIEVRDVDAPRWEDAGYTNTLSGAILHAKLEQEDYSGEVRVLRLHGEFEANRDVVWPAVEDVYATVEEHAAMERKARQAELHADAKRAPGHMQPTLL